MKKKRQVLESKQLSQLERLKYALKKMKYAPCKVITFFEAKFKTLNINH